MIFAVLFIQLGCVICVDDGFVVNDQPRRMKEDKIERINLMQHLWTAGFNYVSNMSDDEIMKKMGVNMGTEKFASALPAWVNEENYKIPNNFDVRKAWPKCTVAEYIPDQSVCGSCWAVAVAATFSVSMCVGSRQIVDKHLSAEDVLTCCKKCINSTGDGCQGGSVEEAFSFIMENGICTGGDYGSEDGCKPYSTPPCTPSWNNSCNYEVSARPCQLKCTNRKYRKPFWKDKYFGRKLIQVYNRTEVVQKIMMRYGSVLAVFKLFSDFKHYRSGVYFHVLGKFLGWHAIRLLGWGTENGINYWLGANSWNTSWGDHGTVKVHREENMCDFNYFLIGIP